MNKRVVVGGVTELSAGGAGAGRGAAAKRPGRATPPAAALLGRPQRLTVSFTGGRSGTLDTSDARGRVWADVLLSLRDSGQPAYVEIDPATGAISELLLPVRDQVKSVRAPREGTRGDGAAAEVELVFSHAIHFVRGNGPGSAATLRALRRAQETREWLLVTRALDKPEIIDVRPAGGRKPRAAAGGQGPGAPS